MLVNRKIINYGALASILCLVVFATDATKAQNASPSASPVAAATPAASASPTPVGPDSTATANKGGTRSDVRVRTPAETDVNTGLTTVEGPMRDDGRGTIGGT